MHTTPRHAYLILAHTDFSLLQLLLRLLDSPENTFFVHIDKKSTDAPSPEQIAANVTRGSIRFVPRMRVYWGHSSQCSVYLHMLRHAEGGPFAWYHFLSGACLPLKPIEEINAFFNSISNTADAVMETEPAGRRTDRLKYYYLTRNATIQRILNALQAHIGINRLTHARKLFPEFHYGSTWFDLTPAARDYILSRADDIKHIIPFTRCADEIVFQTAIAASGLRIHSDNHRYIDWSERKPNPKTLTIHDLTAIRRQSCALFARKFHSVESCGLIRAIHPGARF